MDHPCHKCGHSIEEGKPFCAQCGAPQIRVMIPEPSAASVLAAEGIQSSSEDGAHPILPGIPSSSLPGSWSGDLKPCALAAAITLVLTFLGLNPFVAALGVGFLAVVFSRHRGAGLVTRPTTGARLGATGGLLLFGMSVIFEMLAVAVLHKGAELRSEMIDKIQQAASRYPGPEVQPFLDFVKSPEGFTLMIVASLIFGLAAFVALGSFGGAIGTLILRRRNRS